MRSWGRKIKYGLFLYFLFFSFWLLGCVSPHHMGVNQYEEGRVVCRPLGKKTASSAEEFDKKIIEIIQQSEYEELENHFSEKFLNNLTPIDLALIKNAIEQYMFDGQMEPMNTHGKISIDEIHDTDEFKTYHFIHSSYRLSGNPGANLALEYKRTNEGNIELIGLWIFHPEEELRSKENSFQYRFLDHLETNDSVPYPCGLLLP